MKQMKKITFAAAALVVALGGGFVATNYASANSDVLEGLTIANGMSIRMNEPEGLRFSASINMTKAEMEEAGILEVGSVLMPASKVDGALEYNETNGSATALLIPTAKYYEETADVSSWFSALVNTGATGEFPVEFYNTPISARAYAKYSDTEYKYSESTVTRSIGYVAAIKITRDQLNGAQNVLSPYMYIGKFEAEGGKNEPIVMFARDPGMVIDYSVTGPWVKGISFPESTDEFVFAFYMPATNKKLKSDLPAVEYAGMSLGEYLRACEASDHMGWDDPAKMQIVSRIQKNTINQIENKIIKSVEAKVDATASKLAAKLGKSLLPRVGYGKKKGSGGGGGNGGGGKLKNLEFDMLSMSFSKNEIEIPFKLKFSHARKVAEIELIVASEAGWITPHSWQSDIGTAFPASITSVTVNTVVSNIEAAPIEINGSCSAATTIFETDQVLLVLGSAEDSQQLTSIKVVSHMLNLELTGSMKIKAYDKKYRFSIKAE